MLVLLAVLIIVAMTLFDILSRDPALVRLLPKAVWAILTVLLPLIGSVLWFVVGRRADPAAGPRTIVVREPPAPSRTPAPSPASPAGPVRRDGPLSTEEQLAALEREIEEDRVARRIAELETELRRRRTSDEGEPA